MSKTAAPKAVPFASLPTARQVFSGGKALPYGDFEPKPEVLERIKEFNIIPFDKIGIQNEI